MRDQLQWALDFAVAKEREAEAFYKRWAGEVDDPAVKALFAELAAAERGHMEILSRITPDELLGRRRADGPAPDLEFSELLIDVFPSSEMTVSDAMRLAVQREQVSVALYERLAEFGGEARPLMTALAAEERRHRARLEAESDGRVPTES